MDMPQSRPAAYPAPDLARIDRLMDAAGLEALVVTSRHNVQYLLGGYRFIFFSAMDAIGHSRYLPVVVYRRGGADTAAYIGNRMEGAEHANHPFWTPTVLPICWGSVDAAEAAAAHLKKIGAARGRIGIEPGFLPVDAWQVLAGALGADRLADATGMPEQMRAIKTPAELDLLRQASELITDAMGATMAAAGEGWTKHRIIEELRRQERIAAGLAAGRGDVDGFGRQLSRLYWRSVPHGRAGRAGSGTGRSSGRDRDRPAGCLCQGRAGRAGRGPDCRRRGGAEGTAFGGVHRFLCPWHGPDQP